MTASAERIPHVRVTRFEKPGDVPVVGFLHRPEAAKDGLVFTHGAGSDSGSALLVALASAFAESGIAVLRCDLPFRQARRHGPPRGDGATDRLGLEAAVTALRAEVPGRLFLGGQSYGGRQATMLCADKPSLADGLLLTSYPLHPPGKYTGFRTQHFPRLKTDALFIHGTSDPFASTEEMQAALKLIPARTALLDFESAGHDLATRRKIDPVMVTKAVDTFVEFFRVV